MPGRRRDLLLLAATLALSLFFAELAARLAEKRYPGKFHLFRERTYEAFFYHYRNPSAPVRVPVHDPLLGWRNFYPAWEGGVNPDGWRLDRPFHEGRKRIALVGDSFVFGPSLHDPDTISFNLERELNGAADVLNFGARGWGLDQIALAATHVAMTYHPSTVVLAFIAADLDRSCTGFYFNLTKPYFVMLNGKAEPAGIPVPTPQMKVAEHATPSRRFLDAFEANLIKLRLVRLAGQVALEGSEARCIGQLNPAILDYVTSQIGSRTRVIFVHLDGDLPQAFAGRVKALPNFTSIPPRVARISRETGIAPGRLPDGHPNGSLNRIYARALKEILSAPPGSPSEGTRL